VQLDQARIAICERSWADNLDLALHVLRSYGAPLAVCALVAMVPLAVFNHLLLTWAFPDAIGEETTLSVYYWLMNLVMIEAPLATAPMTLYLGYAMFAEKPRPDTIARDFLACLPQLLLLQLVLRAVFIVPVASWIGPYALWPYLSEIILLERNPLTSRAGRPSTWKRSAAFHSGASGEYLVRAVAAALLAFLLIVAIYKTEDLLWTGVMGIEQTATTWLVEVQVAFWIVVAYFTTARFLTYLDQRIRNEGWEVELLLRAQRERLMRQLA
jgi:hypothetical protein